MKIADLATTPAFLVDEETVQANCDRMRAKAAASGVLFRPHVKTHKVLEVALLQGGGERGPITVSTLAEAELFAAHEFRDITYAVPIAPEKLYRAATVASTVDALNLLVDSFDAVQAIEAFSASRAVMFDVFLKIDCGYHRAGVDPDDPLSIALALRMASSPAIRFRGLLTHAGHSYNVTSRQEIVRIAADESSAVTRFRDRLSAHGVEGMIRSVGSTPTLSVVERIDSADEVRPGNYVFYDAFQATIGACSLADCAVSVLTTVIGSYPDRNQLVLDAGALALSKDAGPTQIDAAFGYGIVCDLDLVPLPLRITALSQEHGKVEVTAGSARDYAVGRRLRIIPNHSCLTAAMFDRYHVLRYGAIADEWRPARGW
jgi:D-serine deaminase-like pyridoxal phosphate-dependent protein